MFDRPVSSILLYRLVERTGSVHGPYLHDAVPSLPRNDHFAVRIYGHAFQRFPFVRPISIDRRSISKQQPFQRRGEHTCLVRLRIESPSRFRIRLYIYIYIYTHRSQQWNRIIAIQIQHVQISMLPNIVHPCRESIEFPMNLVNETLARHLFG